MMEHVNFKNNSERLKKELNELKDKNSHLFDLIEDLAKYVKSEFNKELTITMIHRTQEEQDSIYKDDPKYKERKFKSPHMFWHSVDLRSRDYTKEEIAKTEQYLNDKYNSINYYKWTARNHNVGLGDHYHIQLFKVK